MIVVHCPPPTCDWFIPTSKSIKAKLKPTLFIGEFLFLKPFISPEVPWLHVISFFFLVSLCVFFGVAFTISDQRAC